MWRYATLTLLLLHVLAIAQTTPVMEWQRNLGGSLSDFAGSIAQTADGGYIVCGTTFSNNGDVSGNHGLEDIWVVKLDPEGNSQWQRCLGGSSTDFGKVALQMPNGGYLVVGSTSSNNGDVSGNHGSRDTWLAKLDAAGVLVWQRCYGGSLGDVPWDITSTPDGGYVVVGGAASSDGDLTTNAGAGDYWILKIDAGGEIQWQRTYGGSFFEDAYSVALTSDGGYLINGYTESNDGDVNGSFGIRDYWVLKLDGEGFLQWQRPCGGSSDDSGFAITELNDGSSMAVGRSLSQDGDVSPGIILQDIWTIRLSATGAAVEERSYGGSNLDFGRDVMETADGGMILSGATRSTDGDIPNNQGQADGWLFRTDLQGEILWNLTLGGSQSDGWVAMQATTDGGYILVGSSESNDGDLLGNNGSSDVWVVKLGADPLGVLDLQDKTSIRVYPNPSNDHIQVDLPPAMRNARWWLHDTQGKVVASGRAAGTRQQIALQHLAPGAYTLVVEAGGKRISEGLVKE